jgi:hypothetical protein
MNEQGKRQERLYLLIHPTLEAISEQFRARIDGCTDDSIYGTYEGAVIGKDILDDPSQYPRVVEISPEKIEQAKNIGSYIITGITKDSREAVVVVNPFEEDGSQGSILLF